MEDTLREVRKIVMCITLVLILVLMEDTLRVDISRVCPKFFES